MEKRKGIVESVVKLFLNMKKIIEKIVINIGLGRLRLQPNFEEKILPEVMKEVSLITGQKPMTTLARQSIAGFKVRKGEIVGLKVTLRRKRMEDFLKKIVSIVLPRVKDFKGISLKQIDENGNLNIGFREQFVFPEIQADQSKVNFGLQVTIVPKAEFRKRAKSIVS